MSDLTPELIERQCHHQPDHLLSRQTSMTNARRLSLLHSLLDPLERQMLAQSMPVRRFKVIGQEVERVVEHRNARQHKPIADIRVCKFQMKMPPSLN